MLDQDSTRLIGCDNNMCVIDWFHVECIEIDLDSIPQEYECAVLAEQ